MSRLTFFDHFSIQNFTFDLGMVAALQPCRCQKHPRTSMIVFALGIKAICLILGAMGYAGMQAAIFADVGVMVLAVLNAIRALIQSK